MQIKVNAQTIRDLHAEGLNRKQIAERLNVPVARVGDFFKQLGLGRVKSKVYVLEEEVVEINTPTQIDINQQGVISAQDQRELEQVDFKF